MTEVAEFQQEPEKKGRPGFLTVLGILSFIPIGANLLIILFQLAVGRPSDEALLEQRVELTATINELKDNGMDSFVNFFEQAMALNDEINANFYLALMISFVTYLVGLFGVIMMWKAKKLGFHLYILYCLLALGGIYIYASAANVSSMSQIFSAVISAAFIFMYSRNLHWMK
ncbi:MAG: hypothetical protein EP333_00405 [Bacteroidetes bacterium]|nr:MAG: hypothetical protein EP333_00405 [Bacteroidota bacterium]